MNDDNQPIRERTAGSDAKAVQEPAKVLSHEEFLRAKAKAVKNFDSFRARFAAPKKRG
jgi:hypothetical protein